MKIQKVYECQQCFTIHDDEWDAKRTISGVKPL